MVLLGGSTWAVLAQSQVDFFAPEALAGYVATAIFALFNLFLTYLILRLLLHKPLMKILKARREQIDASLLRAQEKEEHANALSKAYQEQMDQAERRVSQMFSEAERKLDEKKRRAQEQLDQELLRRRQRADEEIRLKDAKAKSGRQEEVLSLSMQLIGQVLPSVTNEAHIETFLADAKKDLKLRKALKGAEQVLEEKAKRGGSDGGH